MKFLWLYALCLMFLGHSAEAGSLNSFRWLTIKDNFQIYQDIQSEFSEELKPDIPEKVAPYVANSYKFISNIGCFDNSCIVIVGYRGNENESEVYTHFRAFGYNSTTKKIYKIEPQTVFWNISIMNNIFFEKSKVPDIVFKYFDCMDCERVELLSSFSFNEGKKIWGVRVWPENDPHLMIGSDSQYGDDLVSYECIHKISDINNDGFDDIVIWCRSYEQQANKINDDINIYTVESGKSIVKKITNKKRIETIKRLLCTGQQNKLCER